MQNEVYASEQFTYIYNTSAFFDVIFQWEGGGSGGGVMRISMPALRDPITLITYYYKHDTVDLYTAFFYVLFVYLTHLLSQNIINDVQHMTYTINCCQTVNHRIFLVRSISLRYFFL